MFFLDIQYTIYLHKTKEYYYFECTNINFKLKHIYLVQVPLYPLSNCRTSPEYKTLKLSYCNCLILPFFVKTDS